MEEVFVIASEYYNLFDVIKNLKADRAIGANILSPKFELLNMKVNFFKSIKVSLEFLLF